MISREYVEQIEERAVEEITALLLEVGDSMIDADGLAYGDEPFDSDEDFVAYYIDLRDRGVLAHLAVIAPKFHGRLRTRFNRAAGNALGLGGQR